MMKPNHVAATGDEELDRILLGTECTKGDSYRFYGRDPLHEMGIMRSTVSITELLLIDPNNIPMARNVYGEIPEPEFTIIIDTETGETRDSRESPEDS